MYVYNSESDAAGVDRTSVSQYSKQHQTTSALLKQLIYSAIKWLLLARVAASFKRPLLLVDVFVCLCVANFDAKYLVN